jgi:hypothetical protein
MTKMRTWLAALAVIAAVALSVGLPTSPAGALDPATVSIAGTPNPATTGSVTYDVTVSGAPGTAPTGTVGVDDGEGGTCTVNNLTDDGLGDGVSTGNCPIIENASGSPYTVTATYNGDSTYSAGADNTVTENVNTATPTVGITGNPNPGTTGSITYDVSVTGGGATPTGRVDVSDGEGGACSINSLSGGGAGSCSIIENAANSPSTVTATYNGDGNYSSTSNSVSETVNAGTANLTITGNPNPGTTGSISYHVTVTGNGATPTGTVAVADGDGGTCPITLSSGAGDCSIVENAANSPYTVTAIYTSGDGNYLSGATNTVNEVVNAATPTVSITGNPNPGPTGSITYDVTVSGDGATPTGSVSVSDGQGGTCSINSLTGGAGSCSIAENASHSPYTVTATYSSGDTNYTGSSDHVTETIQAGAPTVAITGNPNPGTTGGITYDVTVTGSGQTPTGTVSVADGVGGTCTIASLSGGAGNCSIVENAANSPLTVTATYNGDTNYASGETNTVLETVTPATPTVAVTGNPNPGPTGSITYDVTVAGGGAAPTGSVSVTDGKGGSCSIPSLSAGAGSCAIFEHAVDSPFTVTATYDGDSNYVTNNHTVTENVVIATPGAPSIDDVPIGAIYGGSFPATLSTISDGTPSVTSSTAAVCAISGLMVTYVGVGTCTLTAHTSASPNYAASNGAQQNIAVGLANPSIPSINDIPSGATEFSGFVASVVTTGDGVTSVASISTAVCTVGGDGHTVSFVGFGVCTLTASVAQGAHFFGATGNTQSFPVGPAARGYWLVGSDGGIFSFGAASFFGSMGSIPLQRPVVGITPSASRTGYWLVASDGGIFSFGSSSYYGSIPAVGLHPAGSGVPNSLNAPIVGMVPSVTGHGYFMVASDGGVFAFGDARFAGSCPGIGGCAGKAVAVMPDSTGHGYWLVTNTGNVYAFGDATFYGAPAPSTAQVVDAVATQDWRGYWLLYNNGAVASFGDATAMGAPLGFVNGFNPATSIFPTADGEGYWIASGRGDVFAYGDAPYLGSEAASGLNGEIIAAFGF